MAIGREKLKAAVSHGKSSLKPTEDSGLQAIIPSDVGAAACAKRKRSAHVEEAPPAVELVWDESNSSLRISVWKTLQLMEPAALKAKLEQDRVMFATPDSNGKSTVRATLSLSPR